MKNIIKNAIIEFIILALTAFVCHASNRYNLYDIDLLFSVSIITYYVWVKNNK